MSDPGSAARRCSRQTCTRDAVTTLTYVYSDSIAVLGPLAGHAEPHAYDLCAVHSDRLTVPRGWRVVRLELPESRAAREDIGAVAEAVREPEAPAPVRESPRRVLRDVSLPRPATSRPATSRPATPRRAAPSARETPSVRDTPSVREAPSEASPRRGVPRAQEAAWSDVPVPEALRRPHLRRPAAGGRGGAGF